MNHPINGETSTTTIVNSIAVALSINGARFRFGCQLLILLALVFGGLVSDSWANAKFVSGYVPDWEQPYHYGAGSSNGGPGPDPNNPNPPQTYAPSDQWNAWCGPTSAANLAGHWTDVRGVPVADTTPFDSIPSPGSTVAWGVNASWQDYLADSNRPPAQIAAGPLPTNTTDIGWYMDTNHGVPTDDGLGTMGGYFSSGWNHVGTYLRDIHVGLGSFLNCRYSFTASVFWRTGTRGYYYSGGVKPDGTPATTHPNAGSAFNEVKSEIDSNRTVLLSYFYWNHTPTGFTLTPTGVNTESAFGGTYYTWGDEPDTNDENEVWNNYAGLSGFGLGHIVTCVGYIPAGDPDDIGPTLGIGSNNWVIVHDNWFTTPRNVIILFATNWVANTTAVPGPTGAKFVQGLVPDWNQPYQYAAGLGNGGPGADPNAHLPLPSVDQWNAWCAPCSGANLAGHWADFHGWPVADTSPFPVSTFAWAAPSWQDYLADGFARPAPTNAPGRPANRTDIGWYMDTNRGVPYDGGGGTMGGYFYNNGPHTGTYLKDIHAGLHYFFPPPTRNVGQDCWVTNWVTGARGKAYAGGWDRTNGLAQTHPDAASAFGEVMAEINTNRTLVISFLHWNVGPAAIADVPPQGQSNECDYGGTYYTWGTSGVGQTNAEDEAWNGYDNGTGLGHAVTAVGYIQAGDPADPGTALGMGATDWVIVHDNWASTPRNVIIPFDFATHWVANTTVHPEVAYFAASKVELVNATNVVVSFRGIPGTLHDLEWKSEMTNNTWSLAVGNVAYSPGTMQLTNTIAAGTEKRFYHIRAND